MREIPQEQVLRRIASENLWWDAVHEIPQPYRGLRRRVYFELLYPLVRAELPNRAVFLLGPRRVGKTVLLHHAVQKLIDDGVPSDHICYFSVDDPIFGGMTLDAFLDLFSAVSRTNLSSRYIFIFFDEIQYLKDWETHLKNLVDRFRNIKFVASGSSAAALN